MFLCCHAYAKNEEDADIPVSFMIPTFKGAELNYTHIEKQAYNVYKSMKNFMPYLLKSNTKVIVPYAAIRNMLIQKKLGEKRDH